MTRLRASDGHYERPAGLPEGSVLSVFRVPPEVAGQRLDLFLKAQLQRTSRTRAQTIVRASAYDEAGRRMRPGERVHAEQLVLLWRPPWDEVPVPTTVAVLYEDEHLMAVDKPPKLPVHPTARYHNNTLIKVLQRARPGEFLSLGHRIDRETSGVLLVAKSKACDRALKKNLEARAGIEKVYTAITWGLPDAAVSTAPPLRGDGPGRTFRLDRAVELDRESRYNVKMRVSESPSALSASTIFSIEAVVEARGRTYALVRCELLTGRQHQIRVHLASLGAPIVGDKLYGPDESLFARDADGELTAADVELLELPRHALHATELRLPHPITGAPLAIRAPLPEDLREFWENL